MKNLKQYPIVSALLLAALILVAGCTPAPADTPPVETPTIEAPGEGDAAGHPVSALTAEAVKSATYPSEWEEGGEITLTDGGYEGEPFVEGGATRLIVTLIEPIAFGDLDGDGADEAVVLLATNPGGSGTFVSLEAMGNDEGAPVHLASYQLGDRARVESLAIRDGQIVLEMVTHGPDDPMCCPTQVVRNTYTLEGGALAEAASEVIGTVAQAEEPASPAVHPDLVVDITWQWTELFETEPASISLVPDPENYTLVLHADGSYQVKADCNLASGGYLLEGSSLTLLPGPTTLAECEPDSLYDEYLAFLGQVVSFELDGEKLVLNLKDDAGRMGFVQGAAGAEIIDITWQWTELVETEPASLSLVPDPQNYTLVLRADGTYQVKADCNLASGGYLLEGNSLTLLPGPTTLAECEPDSLYDEYLAFLGQVVSFELDGEKLVLNLKDDAGSMGFGKDDTAASSPTNAGIAPQDIRLDTQGLPYSWQPNFVPTTPYDTSQPPGPKGLPGHIQINVGVINPQDRQPGDPVMYIIPVDAYQQMWDKAGNSAVTDALDQIADRTYIANVPGTITALPSEEIVGRNDLAVQIGRAVPFGQLNETSAAQSGYRFVGRWAQDANPVTNQNLTYVYQGFTNDGRYLVTFFYPVTTEALPSIGEVSQEEIDRLSSDYEAYMAEKSDLLNTLDSADFTPNLATLDALVASLEIDGMPVSGLQDKTWQWISGPAQPGSSEIITIENPELYQVTYSLDGTVEIIADCNRASLSYELHQGGLVGGMLAMPGPMTLAECGPGSHCLGFVSSLQAAQTYRVHPGGSELSLILPAGGGELVFRNTGKASEANADITGSVWMWKETTTPTGVTSVDDPEKYTIELLPDGQFRVTADCNSGSGSYTLEESLISLEFGPMTLAECEPDSLYDEFIQELEAAAIYFLEGDNLYIDLMYDSGTMRFVPAG